MAALTATIIHKFNEIMETRHPEVVRYPIISNPWLPFSIVIIYIWFVKSFGPKLMKKQPIYECKNVMIIYNAFQVIFNLYILMKSLRISGFRLPLISCVSFSSDDPLLYELITQGILYYSNKILDLLDTVFMVLRKKEKQISFLHVYHHSIMVILTWVVLNWFAGAPGLFTGIINTTVHSIMYIYYLVTAMYPEYKNNIWWKRHITQLQMVQFALVLLNLTVATVVPSCNMPTFLGLILIIQNAFVIVLFSDFYRKAYILPTNGKTKQT